MPCKTCLCEASPNAQRDTRNEDTPRGMLHATHLTYSASRLKIGDSLQSQIRKIAYATGVATRPWRTPLSRAAGPGSSVRPGIWKRSSCHAGRTYTLPTRHLNYTISGLKLSNRERSEKCCQCGIVANANVANSQWMELEVGSTDVLIRRGT